MSTVSAANAKVVNPIAQSEVAGSVAIRTGASGFNQELRRELGKHEIDTRSNDVVQNEDELPDAMDAEQAQALPWLLMLQQFAANQIIPEQGMQDSDLGDGADTTSLMRKKLQQLVGTESKETETDSELQSTGQEVALQSVQADNRSVSAQMQAANISAKDGKNLPQSLSQNGEAVGFDELMRGRQALLTRSSEALSAATTMQRLDVAQSSPSQNVIRTGVDEPVGSVRWGEVVAQRVSLMLGRQEQQMEMQLNPPNLGPMEVRLTLGADQANVVFASQHAAVREALAAAAPRLTALLADQGIQMVNVQVASDSLQQHAQQQAQQQADPGSQSGYGRARDFFGGAESSHPILDASFKSGTALPVARSGVSLYV